MHAETTQEYRSTLQGQVSNTASKFFLEAKPRIQEAHDKLIEFLQLND
jgi:hypothetical protein